MQICDILSHHKEGVRRKRVRKEGVLSRPLSTSLKCDTHLN